MDVLGSPSLIVRTVSVDVKQHLKKKKKKNKKKKTQAGLKTKTNMQIFQLQASFAGWSVYFSSSCAGSLFTNEEQKT